MMFSRLTACAATFAVLSAATITFAAGGSPTGRAAGARSHGAAPAAVMALQQWPRVEVTGRR